MGGLHHLNHEGGLAPGQVVTSTDPGEDPVGNADGGAAGRNKGADLGHQGDQGHLAHIGGFSCHIGAGDHQQLMLLVTKQGVIRYKALSQIHRFHHRVAPFGDLDQIAIIHHWFAVAPFGGHGGQCLQHIQGGQGSCGPADPAPLGGGLFPHHLEQTVLQLADPVFSPQNLLFVGFQFFSDVALTGGDGLAADIVGRYAGQIGSGHLDVVAKYLVVADLEGADAGAFPFLGLHPGDESLAFAADGA